MMPIKKDRSILKKSISDKLRSLRGKKTQAAFTEKLDVFLRIYSRYERGVRDVPASIVKLARMTGSKTKNTQNSKPDYIKLMEWIDNYPCPES